MDSLNLPKLEKYVNDFSGVFQKEKIEELSLIFQVHEDKTQEQVVVIIFPHRQGKQLVDIGLKVFNENGIGQKDTNNGLLLIIASEEKKLRILVGKGQEYKYTNAICNSIIENRLRPLLDIGDHENVIKEWYKIVSGEIDIKSLPKARKDIHPQISFGNILLFFTVPFAFFTLLSLSIIIEVIYLFFGIILVITGVFLLYKMIPKEDSQTPSFGSIFGIILGIVFIIGGLYSIYQNGLKEVECLSNKKSSECVERSKTYLENYKDIGSDKYLKNGSNFGKNGGFGGSSSKSFGGGGGSSRGGGGGD